MKWQRKTSEKYKKFYTSTNLLVENKCTKPWSHEIENVNSIQGENKIKIHSDSIYKSKRCIVWEIYSGTLKLQQ